MLLDVGAMAVFLLIGNILFHHFDPMLTLPRRIAKIALILAITAAISHFSGHTGVILAFGIAFLAIVCIHGIWLPLHGVNGWTGEPKAKYYELRGWPPSKD